MLKKLTSLLLVLVMIVPMLTVGTVMAQDIPFGDVNESNWFYSAVKTAYEHGIMTGKSTNSFGPTDKMTRAELVTMLSRLAGANVAGMKSEAKSCTDIKGGEWYADYVGWGVSTGLVKGYNDGTFKANNNVKRVELAVLFARFLEYMGITIEGEGGSQYTDKASIPTWASTEVETIRNTGLMKGDNKGNFNAQALTTRAEVATLASRLIVYIYEKELEGEKTVSVSIEDSVKLSDLVSLLNGNFNNDGEYGDPEITNFSEVEAAIAGIKAGESGEVTVKAVYKKLGIEIPVEYTITVTKAQELVDYSEFLAADGTEYTYNYTDEFAPEDAMNLWLFDLTDTQNKYTTLAFDYNIVKTAADALAEGSEKTVNVTATFTADGVKEAVKSYKIKLVRGVNWENKVPESGTFNYPSFLTYKGDEASFTEWLKNESGVTAFDTVTVTNYTNVENTAEGLAEGNSTTVSVSVKFIKNGEAEVDRTYSVVFTREVDLEAKLPKTASFTYTYKDAIDESDFLSVIKKGADTESVFESVDNDMVTLNAFLATIEEGTESTTNVVFVFSKGGVNINRTYSVKFVRQINYENHAAPNGSSFEYGYKYMPDETVFAAWLKNKANADGIITAMTVTGYSNIKSYADGIEGGKTGELDVGVTFTSADGSFSREYSITFAKNVDYSVLIPENGSKYTYTFKNSIKSENDFTAWLKGETDSKNVFDSLTVTGYTAVSTAASGMEQGTTSAMNVSVTFKIGEESFDRTYEITLDKGIDYTTFILAADSEIAVSYKGEFTAKTALEALVKGAADPQGKLDGMTVENYSAVKTFADGMTEGTTLNKLVTVKFTKAGEDDITRNYTLVITRNIDWEARLAVDGTEYELSFKKTFTEENALTAFIKDKAISSGEFTVAVTNYSDVKTAADALAQGKTGNITVNVTFTKDTEGFNKEYTLKVTRKYELESVIAADGSAYTYAFTMTASESGLVSVIKKGADTKNLADTVTVTNLTDVMSAVDAIAIDTDTTLDVNVKFTGDGETVLRTYSVKFSKLSRVIDPADACPENLGIQAEQAGIKVSNVVYVTDTLSGLGAHGGHDTRIVRNEYGTYMAVYTHKEYMDKYPEGSTYCDFCYWAYAGLFKIEPSGVTKVFEYRYPTTMAAAPNVIAGENGVFYLPVIADDKERYLDNGLQDEGAWLAVYEYDAKTGTTHSCEYRTDFKIAWPETYTGGYGYSQPLLDEAHGRMYLVESGGVNEGYMSFYTYDLNTHQFVGDCQNITSDYRLAYSNMYCDGNGGIIMVAEVAAQNDALGRYYTEMYKDVLGKATLQIGNGSSGTYTWDSTYIYHIPDPTDTSTATFKVVDGPDYINNIRKKTSSKWYADGQNSKHYAGGCTMMDDEGNIHVIVTHGINNNYVTYHKIYDTDLNLLYDEEFSDVVPKGRVHYSVNMTQDENGKYYFFVSSEAGTSMWLEVWSSDDGINYTKVTKFNTITNTATGKAASPCLLMIIGNSRNNTALDDVVPFCFSDDNKYYYFRVRLPD